MGMQAENTRWIEMWVVNDADYYFAAQEIARECQEADEYEDLREFIERSLTSAKEGSAAWHTARELSAADYDRVDWQEIAESLTEE